MPAAAEGIRRSGEKGRAMNREKRKALEAAGWVIGDAEDFLELSAEERQLVEVRAAISRIVRERREKQHLTQSQVARMLGTSQPRFAKIEAGSPGVSLDLMIRALFTLGGSVRVDSLTVKR